MFGVEASKGFRILDHCAVIVAWAIDCVIEAFAPSAAVFSCVVACDDHFVAVAACSRDCCSSVGGRIINLGGG